METDLTIRLHLYATATERLPRGGAPACADAISCWRSATASHSSAIVNSHTRILRGDSQPGPFWEGKDELDILIAGKPGNAANAHSAQIADGGNEKQPHRLPLPPGNNSADLLARGAEGVIILKGRNG